MAKAKVVYQPVHSCLGTLHRPSRTDHMMEDIQEILDRISSLFYLHTIMIGIRVVQQG